MMFSNKSKLCLTKLPLMDQCSDVFASSWFDEVENEPTKLR